MRRCLLALLTLLVPAATPAAELSPAPKAADRAALREALTFHASFDHGFDADHSGLRAQGVSLLHVAERIWANTPLACAQQATG